MMEYDTMPSLPLSASVAITVTIEVLAGLFSNIVSA